MNQSPVTEEKKPHSWREYIRVILLALLLSIGVRTFLFQPFTIPSSSMLPTLKVGDYLFVSKYSYGYSRFSLPFDLPLISDRILFRMPHRGDIAIFRSLEDVSVDYVKRIIGLPGDTIQMKQGMLYVNDQPVPSKKMGSYSQTEDGREIVQCEETLPGGTKPFAILKSTGFNALDNTPPIYVPEGHFFVMGDNRDNSKDGRIFGPVPFKNLVGRAQFVLFSFDYAQSAWWQIWKWPHAFRWSRFFHSV